MGTNVFFSAADGQNGYELWKSDGTANGTVLVKTFCQEALVPIPSIWLMLGASCCFELTTAIRDMNCFRPMARPPVPYWSRTFAAFRLVPDQPSRLERQCDPTANSGGIGRELWKSDGTKNGTTLLKDIYPGGTSSSPSELIKSGSYVYFRATDRSSGSELWRTDGTTAGTVQVSDIRSGLYGSYPQQLTDVGGTLFFVARGTNPTDGSSSGYELWKTDGTQAGTVLVKDITPAAAARIQPI